MSSLYILQLYSDYQVSSVFTSFRENYLPAKYFKSYQNQGLIPIRHLTNDDSKGNLLSVLLVALLDFSFVIYYDETIKIPLLLINDYPTEFSLIILPE